MTRKTRPCGHQSGVHFDAFERGETMLLALSTITSRLPESYGARLRNLSAKEELYERPVLYEPGMTFESGRLYLTRGVSLPDKAPEVSCAFICVGTASPWQKAGRAISMIHIPRESNLAVVFNAVSEIYNACDRWDCALRDEIEKNLDFDIKSVLTIGSDFLSRPISVVDQNLKMILYTKIQEMSDGTRRASASETAALLSTEINEQIKEVCHYERVIREPYITALDYSGQSYCNNLYPLGHFAGCISISENGDPFLPGEFPLMDHFYALFQKAFLKYLQSYGRDEESGLKALENVLNHIPLSRKESELLSLSTGEQWCCFTLREKKHGRSFPNDYMHATISGIFPKTVYAVLFRQSIVGLVRVPETNAMSIDPTLTALGEEIRRMGYYGGVSNTFSDLSELDQHLLQAEFAVGQGDGMRRTLYYFHDYALSYLLDACTAEMSPEEIMGQGLKNLIAYDKTRGSEHVRTLDLYLKNETSIARTAEELFIHRSSLLKRLDKIKKVLNDDLSDPGHRLYYRLCLALIERKM